MLAEKGSAALLYGKSFSHMNKVVLQVAAVQGFDLFSGYDGFIELG